MNMDTNEITINRIVGFPWNDGGTDVEDELPTPAVSPSQIVVPAIPPAGTEDPFSRGGEFRSGAGQSDLQSVSVATLSDAVSGGGDIRLCDGS